MDVVLDGSKEIMPPIWPHDVVSSLGKLLLAVRQTSCPLLCGAARPGCLKCHRLIFLAELGK